MRHVFSTMGTVVSIESPGLAPETASAIEEAFGAADQRFSLYRDDSELGAVNAGRVGLPDAGPALRDAHSLAVEWRILTGGAFTPVRPDGQLDLNGVVKALAMKQAAALLERAGLSDWTLVVGGDLLASGHAPDGRPWVTGIVDPADRGRLLCSIQLRGSRRAIATSGTAERGDHIWKAGTSAASFAQVTVVADDIVTADVLATAIVAGGEDTLSDACARWDVDVLAVEAGGGLRATPGFRAALAEAA
jgi:thiamine biosynthesis lipoprotein